MNEFAALLALCISAVYWVRMRGLVYKQHGWMFVGFQALNGGACIYAAYDLWEHGLDVPGCLIAMMAASYLLRSKQTFFEATTRPADIGAYDLTQVHGGHK